MTGEGPRRRVELHPGLVVLRVSGGLSRGEQWAWVEPVIDWLIVSGEPLVNGRSW